MRRAWAVSSHWPESPRFTGLAELNRFARAFSGVHEHRTNDVIIGAYAWTLQQCLKDGQVLTPSLDGPSLQVLPPFSLSRRRRPQVLETPCFGDGRVVSDDGLFRRFVQIPQALRHHRNAVHIHADNEGASEPANRIVGFGNNRQPEKDRPFLLSKTGHQLCAIETRMLRVKSRRWLRSGHTDGGQSAPKRFYEGLRSSL